VDGMDVFKKLRKDFNELVKITYSTYWNLSVDPQKNYSTYLRRILEEVLKDKECTFNLIKEDLEQELRTLWLSYQRQYKINNYELNITLRSYIIRRSVWDLRDWVKRHVNIISVDPNLEIEEENKNILDFKLDLMFLLRGTNHGPLKYLCGYERYIIFLKFKEEKSILEMSKILQKDRRIIKKHFDLIIEKLKKVAYHE
jgi:hypothetical protein